MHSHKHTPAPRWLNCAPMHLQSQIQPLMAPTCINASLHTQNAFNQLKSSALWIKCAQVHLMTQIKTYNAGMSTHAHPMLRNTSKEHHSSTCAPPNSRWPPKPQSSSKALQNSSKAPKVPPRTLQKWKLAPPTNTKPQDLSQCTQAIKLLIMQLTCVGP